MIFVSIYQLITRQALCSPSGAITMEEGGNRLGCSISAAKQGGVAEDICRTGRDFLRGNRGKIIGSTNFVLLIAA
jgi:hypothetical protein